MSLPPTLNQGLALRLTLPMEPGRNDAPGLNLSLKKAWQFALLLSWKSYIKAPAALLQRKAMQKGTRG